MKSLRTRITLMTLFVLIVAVIAVTVSSVVFIPNFSIIFLFF